MNLLACAIQTWLPVVGSGKVSPRVEATRPIWIKASESATIPKAGSFGTWRSLVAHLTGGQGVAGSNPVVPTVVVSQVIINGCSETPSFTVSGLCDHRRR